MNAISRITLAVFLTINTSAYAQTAKNISPVLQAFIQEILQNRAASKYKDFSVKDCPKHKIDWTSIIFRREKPNLTYTFAKGCDIEGTVSPQVLQAFPIQFKMRHLDKFEQIKGEAKLAPTLSTKPLLRLDLTSTEISSNTEKIRFNAYYETEIDPLSKKVIGKHLGGKIFIEEVNGKAVQEEFPLPAAQLK
ncbi:MAG: hypothetical protein ACOVP4_04385 [Bacteriovoracaceae bacterium]